MNEQTSARDDEDSLSMELPEIIAAIRRRPLLIAACAILGGAAFCMYALRQPKIYAAAAEIIIDPVLPKVLGEGFDVDDMGARASAEVVFYNTQFNIIQSRKTLAAVTATLALDQQKEFLADYGIVTTDAERRRDAVEQVLRARLTVAPEKNSRIASLVVEDYDAARAAQIANAIAHVYIQQSLEERMRDTQNASAWLDTNVIQFAHKLERAERELAEFKRENTLVSVSLEDRKNMIANSLGALNTRLVEVRNVLIGLEAERKVLSAIRAGSAAPDDLRAAPRIAKNESIARLNQGLIELEQKKVDLASRYGELHPNMVAVSNQIAQARDMLEREVRLTIATLDNEIAEHQSTVVGLEAAIKVEVDKAMNLNNLGLEYSKKSRELGTIEKTYHSLLKRRTETDLSARLKSNFVRLLETAEPRRKPVRPSVPMQTALGLMLGLMLGLSIAIGGVLFDKTIHTQQDIEDRLRLAFLGLLPAIEGTPRRRADDLVASRGRDLFIVSNPKSNVAECARSLRTNLMFMGTEKQLKRLLFTSAGPSEGKSTTTIALGTTMALAGNRVLVVDTDLRRPRLHKTFGLSGSEGVTSVLLGDSTLDAAIKSTDVRGLDLLPCGPLPPNPSELLHTEKFHKLIEELDARYDRILFDSPPVNAVTDASILAQMTDGTVLVVKAAKTTKDAARRAARQLLDVRAKMLGVVLNDVDFSQGGYYYSHYYHYYRSGYGYGSDQEKGAEV